MRNLDDLEIISQYNSEILGFYNYYSIVNNSCVIDSFITLWNTACIKPMQANIVLPRKR